MIVDFKGAILVRPQLMADGSKRLLVDFGERLQMAQLDDLIGKSLTISIVPDEIMDKMKSQINDN